MDAYTLTRTSLLAALFSTPAGALAQNLKADLIGFEEVPAVSTGGSGSFSADIDERAQTIRFELSYEGLEGAPQQAHIHLGQRAVAGGIAVFLCSNLANPPPGTQGCPTPSGTVSGTIQPNDVLAIAGPPAQGLAAGEFDELIRAMREGVTYVNVHTTLVPTGEIRGQIKDRSR